MPSWLITRLTYANVTATLALFIALGGGAYAAITLPANSVGSRQIRAGAVHSSEIKDRSVRLRDMSLSARTALTGQQGPVGPQGPAGAPAIKYFAAATSGGRFVRGNAVGGGHDTAIGSYTVTFAQPVSSCAYSATLGTTDATTTVPDASQSATRAGVSALRLRRCGERGRPTVLRDRRVLTAPEQRWRPHRRLPDSWL